MTDDEVAHIARLLSQRNAIDDTIAAVIRRPMAAGHLGEWIAAQVFDIELEQSAVTAAIDGQFRSGPLQGCTVNVKWYQKLEGLLDMSESSALDYYLVLTGPRSAALTSRGGRAIVNTCGSRSLSSFGLRVLGGPFDELSADEGRSGADQGNEVRRVDSTPAVLG